MNLYKDSGLNVTAYSYSIKNKNKHIIHRKYGNIEEFVFPSQFNYGTFSISIRYFLKIIFNCRYFKYLHLQHPDPFTVFSILIVNYSIQIEITITWHAEIYKSYYLLAPFYFDRYLSFLSFKNYLFTPSHIKDSLLSKFYFRKIILIPIVLILINLKNITQNNENKNQKKMNNNILSIGDL